MAEVQDSAPGTPEPSMEEILASIRKIISDEHDPNAAPAAGGISTSATDVVELTQMVQDDGSIVDVKAASPQPEVPVMPAPPSPPKVEDAAPVKASSPKPAAAPAPSGETLVSDTVATEAASSLSSLASTVEIERLSSAPTYGSTPLGNGSRTLEDMTIELMRPMLKQWLDQNLPPIVDRLVQKEIERIVKRAKD
jgi:cell pole-organizing protein PopZ